MDGGGQGVAWARADPQSPGKQKTNLPGPSELRLVSRHTEVVRAPGGCERRVCRIRVRRAQSLRLPALGVWPGKWATRCPHISTPVISHAEGEEHTKHCALPTTLENQGGEASSCSVSPLSSTGKVFRCVHYKREHAYSPVHFHRPPVE